MRVEGLIDTARSVEFAINESVHPLVRKQVFRSLNRTQLSLDKLGSSLSAKYQKAYKTILQEGYSRSEIKSIIEGDTVRGETAVPYVVMGGFESMNSFRNRVRTLSDTLGLGLSRLEHINSNLEVGINRFEYSGNPNPERDFCVEHFGRVYTIDEISRLDNGQGLDVLTYCGGYNCRHIWIGV